MTALLAAALLLVGASGAPTSGKRLTRSGFLATADFVGSAGEPAPSSPRTAGPRTVTISWVGDTILGSDDDFAGATLPQRWAAAGRAPDYFFQNVARHLRNDDLTVANFEVALTDERRERDKGPGETYHFHGEPALAQTLTAGGIDVVTLANNHTYDYLRPGFDDTTRALDAAGVGYVGTGDASEGSDYDYRLIRRVGGVNVGLVGYQTWLDTPAIRAKIRSDFATLRAEGAQVVIPYFHWGIEAQYRPYEVQTELARHAIDAGADAVIGTHPHVLQSMSTYRGRLIAYSLGNFAFGGNTNPADKRTMILQTRITVTGERTSGVEFRVIPTRLSRSSSVNDYVPTPYRGAERAEVVAFLNEISPSMRGRIGTRFVPVP